MGTVDHVADEVVGAGRVERLPQRVQDALGELAGAAKEGLLALSVGVGLGVLHEIVDAEVDEVVGPKGRHDPDRAAVRHGHESGEVTLGGRRVPISRPRARTADGEREVELDTYAHFAARDQLADGARPPAPEAAQHRPTEACRRGRRRRRGCSVPSAADWRIPWRAAPPRTTKPAPKAGFTTYRYGDSNPGFRRERAAS